MPKRRIWFLGAMDLGVLVCDFSACLCVCLSVPGGSRAADPSLTWERQGDKAKRPTLGTHTTTHPGDPSTYESPPVWSIDLWITAGVIHRLMNHRQCGMLLYQKMVYSISMFYLQKWPFCDVIQLKMISRTRRIFFYIRKLSTVFLCFILSKLAFCEVIQQKKWSVEYGASFLLL